MADTFHFELVSPVKLLFSAEAAMVVVPGVEGDFAVMPGHAPVISTVRPGMLDISLPGGEKQRVFVRGGFADVAPDALTVLAEFALPESELDKTVLAQQIKNAQEDVDDAASDEARNRAQEHLDHLIKIESAL
ncbi:MAG: F0F1 ATP synthase subunit epsilon [Hyphomicrobiales bacterium]|nr:MAG: F0F1 ATP synthase subunit epsilon [Hyphomicrobiales bacterium]